jgi:cell cycle checkpoint protein
MGLDLVSWHNPVIADSGPTNSIALQFDEFLNRGGQFGGLTFNGEVVGSPSDKTTNGRILLVEEFPATITRSSSTLQSFRSVLLRFLARASHSHAITMRGQQTGDDNAPPVVIIISETLLSSSTALADSFTAHRLLGPEILNHPYVTAIDFNPVAPTFVTKALDLVVKKEARDSGRRRMPGPAIMQRLAEMTDVRSAVNALEFLCVRTGDGSEWSGTIAAKPKKSSKDKEGVHLTDMEKKSLQLVSHRETTLDMFHATGKIVYNKREDPRMQDTRAEPPPKPPDHLLYLYSPKASLVDIELLLNETGTDIQTFISTLHENYILSCNGDTFEEAFDGCSDSLSTSDILNPDSRPYRRANNNPNAGLIQSNLQAGSSDTLRQDEISFHAATRGLLFNLPYPVNRANVPGGKRGDTFKMFYPQSLRLWKPTEETESLIEMFVYGTDINHTDPRNPGSVIPGFDGGVASWQSRTFMASHSISQDDDDDNTDDEIPSSQQVRYNKDTLTLEILPYMARIRTSRKEDTKILDRITHFKPNAYLPNLSEGEESFENEMDGKDLSLQHKKPTAVLFSPPRKGVIGSPVKARATGWKLSADLTGPPSAAPPIEKLYLDDDDIVDD